MNRSFYRRLLFGVLLALAPGATLRAWEGPIGFVMDLPFGVSQATPIWLGHPVTAANPFATLDLPILPPDPDASLLVTVFFEEKNGGFLRIGWQGDSSAGAPQILSDNFYEGIGMSNQRSLLVTPQTMRESGVLHFQGDGTTLGIRRVKLEWLENQTGITSPAVPDILVTSANGATKYLSQVSGQPPSGEDASWRDRIVNVPVTDLPLRIEEGVEFNLQLDSVPAAARLNLQEAGLPWGQHLVVWLNGKRAGTVHPVVPDLHDEGFASAAKASTPYVGWREGTFFVPVATLAAGLNTLQFSAEADAPLDSGVVPADTAAPLAVKEVALQLDYPIAPSETATTGTPPSAASTSATPTTIPLP